MKGTSCCQFRVKTQEIIKLSESMTIFGTILGQLKYALMLYDEYDSKTLPEYYGGKFPHPFTMLAEEKILIELNNFDHESNFYGKLMKRRVPPEYIAFKRRLKKEGWTKIVRNQLIAHKRRDKKGHFVSTRQTCKIFNPNPKAVRQIGEELKDVLTRVGTYYMGEKWFPELKKIVLKADPKTLLNL
ncbi:MAG: hypothetical protein HY695_16730 [Deltaproteobacteria bacterium]|nr:hypothetical protein [Deltaproteobacteria bacterium]